jgi:uroporphyrin-III C-methyltransferase/precorrin-2 dehydrogenase/sirohydrochlorin ferrochelatase
MEHVFLEQASMSYFPIFLNLHEKPVLLVGGGKVAARKIRALRKAGAAVSVIAAELGDELRELDAEGGIDWIARRFEPALMEGYWLAIAATDDTAVNQAVYEAGEARNIPVNVVDDGAHCRFISPAVVDRAPVQVAISTGGASPMLARAIREWIENLLPQGLGRAAEAAGRLRREIGSKMSLSSRRRAWQFLMERSRFIRWNNRSVEHIVKEMRGELHKRVQGERAGQVYLVGAGPGRAELLTLRAVEVLQEAEVIFHDRLVSPEILERARRDAELVDVGKRAGKHQGVQQRIFELMVEAAREGKTVVRLKGGDAFVFGRGGEELEYLRSRLSGTVATFVETMFVPAYV